MLADSIDAGATIVNFGGRLSNFGGSDTPEMYFQFLDANNMTIVQSDILTTQNSSWTLLSENLNVFPTTRTIRVFLKGTRNSGTDNDSYFDELFLRLGDEETDCSGISSNNHIPHIVNTLNINPNPMSDRCEIILPTDVLSSSFNLLMVDQLGNKIKPQYHIGDDKIIIEKAQLKTGTYIVMIRSNNHYLASSKLMIIE